MEKGALKISVGILRAKEIAFTLKGNFHLKRKVITGSFFAFAREGRICLRAEQGTVLSFGREVHLRGERGATFTIHGVTIGLDFHWERRQDETFGGDLRLLLSEAPFLWAINEIFLEDYLMSVISSEMKSSAPLEFLKAQAVCARSWLVAMLDRKKSPSPQDGRSKERAGCEIYRIYDFNDHDLFDVCADDHCQRYQGIGVITEGSVKRAIEDTYGEFLLWNNEICDARYHKACGGRTEEYGTCWEEKEVPYLLSLSDGEEDFPPITTEEEARVWCRTRPASFCGQVTEELKDTILPAFDGETKDYFRWQVAYRERELEEIIEEKTGFAIGTVKALIPLKRGKSGRIYRLKIQGSRGNLLIGKELEIRRVLSRSHLLSSAFVASVEWCSNREKIFLLRGAGWGHGVGLCQIGAAVMATKGYRKEEILAHYFPGTTLKCLYNKA